MGFIKFFTSRSSWSEIIGAAIFVAFIAAGISLLLYKILTTPVAGVVIGVMISAIVLLILVSKGATALVEAIESYWN